MNPTKMKNFQIKFNHASAVFIGASETHLKKLEIVQKMASRVICGVPRNAHAAPLLEELGLDSLVDRRNKHVSDLVLAYVKKASHPALCELFADISEDDPTGGQTSYRPRTTIGSKAFSVRGRQIYSMIRTQTDQLRRGPESGPVNRDQARNMLKDTDLQSSHYSSTITP